MRAPWEEGAQLQRPLPDEQMIEIGRGAEKKIAQHKPVCKVCIKALMGRLFRLQRFPQLFRVSFHTTFGIER